MSGVTRCAPHRWTGSLAVCINNLLALGVSKGWRCAPARWTGSLAVFLRYLRKHFLERLYFEHLPPGASPDDDEDDGAADEDAGGNALGDADMAVEEPDEEPADEAPKPAGEALVWYYVAAARRRRR